MTMDGSHLGPSSLLILVTAATVMDIRSQRIPNTLTVGYLLLVLCVRYAQSGFPGATAGVAGAAAGFALLLPLYLPRWMGAGDVKLMAAVGAHLGWADTLRAVAWTFLFGAAGGFLLLARRQGLGAFTGRYLAMLRGFASTGLWCYSPPLAGEPARLRFPYAFAIALGSLATLIQTGALDPLPRVLGELAGGR
jgi:prepilin peptidase CpaA